MYENSVNGGTKHLGALLPVYGNKSKRGFRALSRLFCETLISASTYAFVKFYFFFCPPPTIQPEKNPERVVAKLLCISDS